AADLRRVSKSSMPKCRGGGTPAWLKTPAKCVGSTMMKKEISTRRPPGPSSPDSDGPFGALRDAGNLIESGRHDEADRQLARYIDAGVDVALSHFATKAIAELAAARMPEAERTLSQSLLQESDYRSNLLLELSEVQWLNGHAEEAVGSLLSRIRG